jgi:hypothetical protein
LLLVHRGRSAGLRDRGWGDDWGIAEWDAEIEVDEPLARELISERFPALDVSVLQRAGEGWDNVVWATADGVAFRFPRRQVAIPGRSRSSRSSRRVFRSRSLKPHTPASREPGFAGHGSAAA